MSRFKVFEYKSFRTGHIDLNWDGTLHVDKNYVWCQYLKMGMACASMGEDDWARPDKYIEGKCTPHYSVVKGDKLFFSEGCKMRRDLFRNSGYKIVLDKDNANYTVIPNPPAPHRMTFDILTWQESTQTLTLYTVDESIKYNTDEVKKSNFDRIKAMLLSVADEGDIQIYQDTILRNSNCWILKKHPCYKEIIDTGDAHRFRLSFIQETNVDLNYPIEISPETLFMWSKMYCNSQELHDAISASDWMKYPATLLVFLKTEWGRSFDAAGASQMFRLVLRTIGYDHSKSVKEVLLNKNIAADDWNMLQKYILYRLNVDENGGTVDKHREQDRRDTEYLKWIRSAVIVKPIYLTDEQNFNNIRNILV